MPPIDRDPAAPPLDRLVQLAVRALGASAALIALRDGAGEGGGDPAGGERSVLEAAAGLPPTWERGAALDGGLPHAAIAAAAPAAGGGPAAGGVADPTAPEPLAVADVRAVPRLRADAVAGELGAVACLAVALPGLDADGAGAGAALGALCVYEVRPRAWSATDRATLRELAGLAAETLARARAARESAALARVATAVVHGAEPDALHRLVAAEVARAFGAPSGAVVRYEDDQRARVVGSWAAEGVDPLPLDHLLSLADGGIAAQLRRGGCGRADGGPRHRPFRHRAGAAVGDAPHGWGFVAVLGDGAPFPAGTEQRVAAFAELIAAALAAAEARGRLSALAQTDPLTGLANQRAFRTRLEGETERARRHGRNLGLALIDLDGFKSVNDTWGHQVGDDVLVTVARRAQSTVRAGELLARLGGDELALLLPEADVEQTREAAERIRQLVAETAIGPVATVTVSAGVSDLALGGDGDGIVRSADDALYWAKALGRDVVARFQPELRARLGSEQRAAHATRRQTLLGIGALARSVDAKDALDGRHSERVAELAVRLARAAGWPPPRLALLREAALVHDVGKIGVVEEARVLAPGEAAAQLREHPRLGAEIAADVLSEEQVAWIRGHHERPDGRGYPDRLAGEAIPLGARLLAVADAWDAMTSESEQRAALAPEQALAECRAGAGTQFDAEAVAALERVLAAGGLAPAWAATPAISVGA